MKQHIKKKRKEKKEKGSYNVIEALIKLVFGFKMFRLILKSLPVCTPFECYIRIIPSLTDWIFDSYLCMLLL